MVREPDLSHVRAPALVSQLNWSRLLQVTGSKALSFTDPVNHEGKSEQLIRGCPGPLPNSSLLKGIYGRARRVDLTLAKIRTVLVLRF